MGFCLSAKDKPVDERQGSEDNQLPQHVVRDFHNQPSKAMQTDERTIVLEQRVDNLGQTVGRVEVKIDGIVDALAGIVRIEERQIASAVRVAEAQESIDNHAIRIGAIENQMPGLLEKAGWVAKAAIGVVCIVGVAVVAAVVR